MKIIPNELDSRALIKNMDEQSLFQRWREERRADIQREVRYRCVGLPFGQRIRTLRHILGMTQRQIAAALGISTRTVIRHERGQCVRAWKLYVGMRELELAHAEELFAYLESDTSLSAANGGADLAPLVR